MDRFMEKSVMDRKIVQLLREGKSFNFIAKQFHVSKVRIKKIKEMANKSGYLDGRPMPPYPEALFQYESAKSDGAVSEIDKKLLEHIDWVKERREAGWHLITILEELPFVISKSSFYRFIKRHQIDANRERSRCRIKVIGEIIYQPGEALLLDWGKLKDVIISGKKRTLWFFAGVLGFSRYMMVRLVWDNKLETTLNALEIMFNEIGGVPHRLISDNPKCFSIEASKYEPLLNVGFERFCQHYDTLPEMLPPRAPEKKGKVERIVPYIRRLFEAYGDSWDGLSSAQEYMDRKVKIANERCHGTTKKRPVDIFLSLEGSELRILPSVSFDIEEYGNGTVRRDGCVRFQNKYYSVGKDYIGKKVFMIGSKETVSIFLSGKLLETHERLTNPYQSKSIKKHHLEPFERIINDGEHYLSRGRRLGSHVENLIKEILLQGRGFIDTRKIWGILSLDKDYSKEEIDNACKNALECGELSYRVVLSFLKMLPKVQEENTSSVTQENKFLRNTRDYLKDYDDTIH